MPNKPKSTKRVSPTPLEKLEDISDRYMLDVIERFNAAERRREDAITQLDRIEESLSQLNLKLDRLTDIAGY